MKRTIYKISGIIDRKPFHSLTLVLAVINLSGVGNPNYLSATALVAVLFSTVVSVFLKFVFRLKRPEYKKHRVIEYGFPSSHSQIAFSLATLYSYYVPYLAPVFLLAASLVGASRFLTKAHTPVDVIGGCVLGIFTGIFSVWTGELGLRQLTK